MGAMGVPTGIFGILKVAKKLDFNVTKCRISPLVSVGLLRILERLEPLTGRLSNKYFCSFFSVGFSTCTSVSFESSVSQFHQFFVFYRFLSVFFFVLGIILDLFSGRFSPVSVNLSKNRHVEKTPSFFIGYLSLKKHVFRFFF